MLPILNMISRDSDGSLNFVPRPANGVPPNVIKVAGLALRIDNFAYVETLSTGAVPSTATRSGGIAFTQDGAMYVTTAAPTSTTPRIDGVAIRADGAVHVVDNTSLPTVKNEGVGMSATGQIITTAAWIASEVLDVFMADIGISQGTATERVSAWAPTLKGSDTLAQATAGNQPLLIPYSGTNYLWLSGVVGNYTITADSAALSIMGDIDIRIKVAFNSYAPAAAVTPIAKYNGGAGTSAYSIDLLPSGLLRFVVRGNSSGESNVSSDAAVPTAAFGLTWLRVTRAVTGGFVIFYTGSEDSAGVITWTQLGTTRTLLAGETIVDTNASLTIGTYNDAGNQPVTGKFYRAQIYNGINGTLVFDANFALVAEGATSFTESSSNAATVTLVKTGVKPAYIVGSQMVIGDAAAYYLQGTFTLNAPYFIVEVAMEPTWAANQVSWDGKTANSFALQKITATPQMRLHDGSLNGSTVSPTLSTWYVRAAKQDSAGNATLQLNLNTPTTDTLSHTAMAGLTVFADGSGANFSSGFKKAICVGNTAISTARLTQLVRAMGAQYGISV